MLPTSLSGSRFKKMSFSDIIIYNSRKGSGGDANAYWKKYRTPHRIYLCLMLILMGVGIGLMSLFVCSAYLSHVGWDMFLSYLRNPLILALNIAPCILLVFLFYFATGRCWAAFTFPSLILFVLTLVNYYKIRIRSEAFVASDFSLVGEMTGILPQYTLDITGRVLALIGAFLFGVLFSVFLMRSKLKNKWVRIIGVILVIALCAVLYCTVYTSDKVYDRADNSENINVWSDVQVYVSKGFLYPFIHSIPDAFPHPPAGYDEDQAANAMAQYESSAIADEKKVDVIAVMFEAYSDLDRFPQIALTEDIYAPLHQLQAESVSGYVIANVFGGGTIDTERGFLTGYTGSHEYTRNTDSYVRWFQENGYYTQGFHAGDGWFYHRENVMERLGFADYQFLEDYPDGDRTDEFFFSALTEMYETRPEDTPYFNFSVTYQNHGAYATDVLNGQEFVKQGSLSEESYYIINNYLTGIADTTARMQAFVDSFRTSEEPVVIVFFGDHMPWMGDGNQVLSELGINVDPGTEEGFYNYYSVPYLIWANSAAKEVLGNDFTGYGGNMSSCFLMNKLFTLAGWGKSGFMNLSDELYTHTPIYSTATGYFLEDGILSAELSPETAALVEQYKLLEYYKQHDYLGG